jgi:CNP1-like family
LIQNRSFKNILKILLGLSVVMGINAHAQYKTLDPNDQNDPDAPRFWEEAEVKIPTAPPSKDLKPFYVSAITQLKFALDAQSIVFGKDEVIRYVVVITSASGAQQVTYEGIRCEKYEWRLYATMQSDGKWNKVANSRWQGIKNTSYNSYHNALVRDAFCENAIPRRSAKEIIPLLKP